MEETKQSDGLSALGRDTKDLDNFFKLFHPHEENKKGLRRQTMWVRFVLNLKVSVYSLLVSLLICLSVFYFLLCLHAPLQFSHALVLSVTVFHLWMTFFIPAFKQYTDIAGYQLYDEHNTVSHWFDGWRHVEMFLMFLPNFFYKPVYINCHAFQFNSDASCSHNNKHIGELNEDFSDCVFNHGYLCEVVTE